MSRLPGWETNSWGYHGDDGYSFASQLDGQAYGPQFTSKSLYLSVVTWLNCVKAGDVIGCGIDYRKGQAFYTKNGAFLGMYVLMMSH